MTREILLAKLASNEIGTVTAEKFKAAAIAAIANTAKPAK